MDDSRREHALHQHVNEGQLIRAMCQTPGFVLLQKKFQDKISKATSRLLDVDTSTEQVLELRRKVQIWTEIEKMLKSMMLTGELSAKALNNLDEFNLIPPQKGQGE